MGLYKRKDSPHWWMSFTANGKLYRQSTGTDNKQLAQKIYETLKAKIVLGKWTPEKTEGQRYTFKDLVERYRGWARGRLKTYTLDNRGSRYYSVNKLERRFGSYLLKDITTQVIETYQSELLAQGLQAGGVNRLISTLKAMMSKACDWNMVTEDQLKQVRKVKPIRGERNRLRYLNKEEISRLIECCDNELRPIVITALSTGMRRGEIQKLGWEDIDFKNHVVLLQDTATKTGEKREIPLSGVLAQTLAGLPRRIDTPYVFPPEVWKNFRKRFASALKKAGIKDFRFHDLRHTFASQMVMAGVDITTVSKLLGHKSLKMTMRYAHLSPSHLKEAAQKISAFLSPEVAIFKAERA